MQQKFVLQFLLLPVRIVVVVIVAAALVHLPFVRLTVD